MAKIAACETSMPFYGNFCKICFSPENIKVCSKCKMVPYCSKEHQTKDWAEHKIVCKMIEHHSMLIAPKEACDFKNLQVCITLAQELLNLEMAAKLITRYTDDHEWITMDFYKSIFKYPRVCMTCYTEKADPELWCNKCYQVGYCSIEHKNKSKERHAQNCEALQRCRIVGGFIVNNAGVLSNMFNDMDEMNIPHSWKELPSFKVFVDTLVKQHNGTHIIPSTDPHNEIVTFAMATCFMTVVATIIYVMERIGMVKNRILHRYDSSRPFVIHIVAGEFDDEDDMRSAILFQYLHNVGSMKTFLCGHTLEKYDYRNLVDTVKHYRLPGVYKDLVKILPKPDIVLAIGVNKPSPDFDLEDRKNFEAFLKHKNIPLVVTSYYKWSIDDFVKQALKVKGAKIKLPIAVNPYGCQFPLQTWDDDGNLTTFSSNHWLTVLEKK